MASTYTNLYKQKISYFVLALVLINHDDRESEINQKCITFSQCKIRQVIERLQGVSAFTTSIINAHPYSRNHVKIIENDISICINQISWIKWM